jgi:hypothetical protein
VLRKSLIALLMNVILASHSLLWSIVESASTPWRWNLYLSLQLQGLL